MSNIKPTKAQMFNGLRKRPTYEEISQEINPDKTKVIYPNRDAKFLREDPRMTQMDGVGFFESMKDQEETTIKEQRKETTMRQMAMDTGEGLTETKIKHGKKEPQHFDISKDDEPEEAHEAELTEKEKYKNDRKQVKKDKMKEHLRKKLSKKKTTEDEFMKQTEQNQKDDANLASAPVTGGASSSQGPDPPKVESSRSRSRSRDKEPKTPKTPKSESEATPKTKKIKVIKKIVSNKTREPKKTKKEEKPEEMNVEKKQTDEEPKPNGMKRAPDKQKESDEPKKARSTKSIPMSQPEQKVEPIPKAKAKAKAIPKIPGIPKPAPEHDITTDNNIDIEHWKKKGLAWIKEQLQLRGVKISNDELKTQHLDDKGKVIKDKLKAVKTKPGLKKEDLVKKIMDLVAANKWIKQPKK
jgi:hypothetical protein